MAKKIQLIVAVLIIVAICALALVACVDEEPSAKEYAVSVAEMSNGTVTINKTKAKAGDEIIVTVTPDENYVLKQGSLKANNDTISDGKFKMPKENVMITAEFEKAEADVRKELNGHNIDNFWGYLKNGDKNFSFRYTLDMSEGEQVAKDVIEILFTPSALMETIIHTGTNIEGEEVYNVYQWLDDGYMYYADIVDGKASSKVKKNADRYGFEIEEGIIKDGSSSFFEPDGNGWKIKDNELLYYIKYAGYNIDDEGIFERFKNLRIVFTDKSVTMTTEVEIDHDGVLSWQKSTYEIYDHGTTSVVIPENFLNADITADETKLPEINGVTFDNLREFMLNGSYFLTEQLNISSGDNIRRTTINTVKNVERFMSNNAHINEKTYGWLDGENMYIAIDNSYNINKKQYAASQWDETLESLIVCDFIFKDAAKYFEFDSGLWRIRPSMINEYITALEAENGGQSKYPRDAFQNLRVSFGSTIKLSFEISRDGTKYEYSYTYSKINDLHATFFLLPYEILSAGITA